MLWLYIWIKIVNYEFNIISQQIIDLKKVVVQNCVDCIKSNELLDDRINEGK